MTGIKDDRFCIKIDKNDRFCFKYEGLYITKLIKMIRDGDEDVRRWLQNFHGRQMGRGNGNDGSHTSRARLLAIHPLLPPRQ